MKIKKLSDVFWETSPNLFFLSIVLSVVVGLAYALLVPFVLYAIDNDFSFYLKNPNETYSFLSSPTSDLAIFYFVALTSIVLFKTLSMILSSYIGVDASMRIRIQMCRKINALSIADLQKLGQAKLINLLNMDVPRITQAALSLPILWVSIITIIGMLGYLAYINVSVFVFVLVSLIVAIVTYHIPLIVASKYINQHRGEADVIEEGCRGLILGAKELKLDAKKFKAYLDEEVERPEKAAKRYLVKGLAFVHLGENYGDILAMVVVGVVVFHLSYLFDVTQLEVFATVLALLYLTGPVGTILSAMGNIAKGNVSLRKVSEFFESADDEIVHSGKSMPEWEEIVLDDVNFLYPGQEEEGFGLHSISATLKRGEITFIVGGNGSGKSTLAKIISTHYQATSGDIRFSGQSIKDIDLARLRECIASIFTDFFVFPSLYKAFDEKKVKDFLGYLELSHKVTINNGRFNTTALSDGQRKRLALLGLMLDDRPICIFDEWAADQDPRFKEIFYYKILPELRNQNKVVIVISHDDRYFSVADQLIVLDGGVVRTATDKHASINTMVLEDIES